MGAVLVVAIVGVVVLAGVTVLYAEPVRSVLVLFLTVAGVAGIDFLVVLLVVLYALSVALFLYKPPFTVLSLLWSVVSILFVLVVLLSVVPVV